MDGMRRKILFEFFQEQTGKTSVTPKAEPTEHQLRGYTGSKAFRIYNAE